MTKAKKPLPIYWITDTIEFNQREFLSYAKHALDEGILWHQFRNKHFTQMPPTNQQLFIETILTPWQALCHEFHGQLFINDDLNLAKSVNAGLHFGHQDEAAIQDVMQLDHIPYGVSCYQDLNRCRIFLEKKPIYISLGAAFASSTKPEAKSLEHHLISEVKSLIHHSQPINSSSQRQTELVVIGGINPENCHSLFKLGADRVAVVAALNQPSSFEKNIQAFKQQLLP